MGRELVEYINGNQTKNTRWTENIKRARNSLNIFIEYACKEVANHKSVQRTYNYLK